MYKKGTWAHIYYHVVIFIWYHKITVTISVKGHLFFREHSINKYIANHHVIQLGLACFILKSNFCQTSLYLYDIDLVHTTINTIYRSDPTVNIMVSTLKQGNNLYKLHMQNGRLMHMHTHTHLHLKGWWCLLKKKADDIYYLPTEPWPLSWLPVGLLSLFSSSPVVIFLLAIESIYQSVKVNNKVGRVTKLSNFTKTIGKPMEPLVQIKETQNYHQSSDKHIKSTDNPVSYMLLLL